MRRSWCGLGIVGLIASACQAPGARDAGLAGNPPGREALAPQATGTPASPAAGLGSAGLGSAGLGSGGLGSGGLGSAGLPLVRLMVAFPALRFSRPVQVLGAGDGRRRLYVLEQRSARVLSFEEDPAASAAEVFLDLSDRVEAAESEQGLLALAFHPRFRDNRRVFAFYSASAPLRQVLAEFRASPDGRRADAASGRVVLEVAKPYPNHNGGTVLFGPDGYLYLGLGDGGLGDDTEGNSQDLGSLLGKVLRLDVDGRGEQTTAGLACATAYSVPTDNPFFGEPGARAEIWAWGLRNPWRMSFDLATGELWAGDVGQDAWEEIDVIARAGNYGWNLREGRHAFGPHGTGPRRELIDPVAEYSHQEGACVVGGHVYRGRRVPELVGAYVHADYISGRIWALRRDGAGTVRTRVIASQPENIASFGEGVDGELYLCAFDGRIYRLEPAGG